MQNPVNVDLDAEKLRADANEVKQIAVNLAALVGRPSPRAAPSPARRSAGSRTWPSGSSWATRRHRPDQAVPPALPVPDPGPHPDAARPRPAGPIPTPTPTPEPPKPPAPPQPPAPDPRPRAPRPDRLQGRGRRVSCRRPSSRSSPTPRSATTSSPPAPRAPTARPPNTASGPTRSTPRASPSSGRTPTTPPRADALDRRLERHHGLSGAAPRRRGEDQGPDPEVRGRGRQSCTLPGDRVPIRSDPSDRDGVAYYWLRSTSDLSGG
jgi:hypothetical protein